MMSREIVDGGIGVRISTARAGGRISTIEFILEGDFDDVDVGSTCCGISVSEW